MIDIYTPNTTAFNIKEPSTDVNIEEEAFKEFKEVLDNSNFLERINKKTGLTYQYNELNIEYSREAEYKTPNTILVDYNRGARAVSSSIHESFHLMLRQINWTENPVVSKMLIRYPELTTSSKRGLAYKMEQMFAYLLQNEIFQEIAKDMKFDASKHYWPIDFIKEKFIPYEFNTEFLNRLALTIIEVWESPNRNTDIFRLIKEVDYKLGQI